jgi:predicted thioesterase
MWVDISVRVAEVKGRLVTFEVTARDALDEIGRGRHTRFVAELAKTRERLAAKRAKAQAAAAS